MRLELNLDHPPNHTLDIISVGYSVSLEVTRREGRVATLGPFKVDCLGALCLVVEDVGLRALTFL